MTEMQQAAEHNPFDPANHSQGGGLWDGKTVTITSSMAKTEALKYGDGSPVLDAKTKEAVIQTALYITGIADGGDDKERHEEYSAGDQLQAAPDGQGFVRKDGAPVRFHANSNLGKLMAALKASGFDIGTLIDVVPGAPPKQQLGRLTGARFTFKAEPKVGKDGKPVKDKKGYDKHIHLPVKYVGHATGTVARGNGGVIPAAGDALTTKAEGAVLAALAKAEGSKLTRAQLVQGLVMSLKGDIDSNAVIGLVIKDDFHKDRAWKFDGQVASL